MQNSGLGQRPPKTFTVVVNGGTGSAGMMVGGTCIAFSVKAPSEVATYDLEFTDKDDYGLAQCLGNTGNRTVSDEFQLYYDHSSDTGPKVTIAGTDGTYTVRVSFKQ